ncbi:alpha/beta hydrolase [Streptomyces sp. NPDC001380]|uniref:alpha/beta hydrolase n=1 Tax=Streptomyces sp. NPDC001380 TaxID=3364566 RepID=UPI0036B56E17
MAELTELKQYARLHARGQGLDPRRTARLLAGVHDDEPGSPTSWARVWSRAGDELLDRRHYLDAARHYTLARFPYPADEFRARAQQRAVAAVDAWRKERGGIERKEFGLPGGTVRAWASGLDRAASRPLLVVMGGIVSTKEQWAPLLPKLTRLGFATVVTELPGVGENEQPYGPDAWGFLPELLDRLDGWADTADTSLLALSFSGHLALRASLEDRRIRRILTVGAPVARFFTDERWWSTQVPGITKDVLGHLTGAAGHDALLASLSGGGWALTPDRLASVTASLGYVLSSRDEIIPRDDSRLLAAALDRLALKEFDDVHGSPAHLGEMRTWLLATLLRFRSEADPRARALDLVLAVQEFASRRRGAGV